jgi:PAS domain S-box-containing protein
MDQRSGSQPAVDVRSSADGRAGAFAVVDESPNPVLAIDGAGTITYLNRRAEAALGYTGDELVGQHVEVLLPVAAAAGHVAQRDAFLAHPVGRPLGSGLDLVARRKDGSEFPVEISLAPVALQAGRWVFATIVDITARRAAEAQLLQARKLESIGRLAGGIAHDFNNVLFAIQGYAELLTEDLAPNRRANLDADDALENVIAISNAAERAASLTAQLLAFSKHQVIRPEVIELNDAITAVEPMLQRLIGEQVLLTVRLASGAGRIRVGNGQVDQILVNLVVNARDAMPNGGTIAVDTGTTVLDAAAAAEHPDVTPGPHAYLSVSDNGSGMDTETREHVFEPFFTTKEKGKGTGLGLATIYGIMQQAGGHIRIDSEPGVGSTFTLYFPTADAPAAAVTRVRRPADDLLSAVTRAAQRQTSAGPDR